MDYDVIVIGGGAAGLSGAIVLARSLRRVLVLDSGQPRNAPAHGVHALLGHDGIPPLELLARGRKEFESYGGDFRSVEVKSVMPIDGGFDVDGVTAKRLIVATGATDEVPDIPGLRERWGNDVIHCPYCHGWEVRGERIVVLALTPMAAHQALLFSQLSPDVTVLANGIELGPEDRRKLEARDVPIVDGEVERVVVEDDAITGVVVAGTTVPCSTVVIGAPLHANSAVLEQLGVETAPLEVQGNQLGSYVPTVDPSGRTSVPGVWVAGNLANPMGQVVHASGAGVMAGAMINMDLIESEISSR